jgi:hypothetical protein
MDECNFHNAQRMPEWRWLRAIGILDGLQPAASMQRDGPRGHKWVKAAMRFHTEYQACTTPLEKYQLSERRGRAALYWAYDLWQDDGPLHWTVDALILARESDRSIGFRCGLDPRVVEAYEGVFFNVRDRLLHTELVVKCILRQAVRGGFQADNPSLLWKLYAYFYGPEMFAALSQRFVNPVWVDNPDGVSAAIESDAISTLKLKAMLAAKTVNVNAETQMDLINAFTAFVDVERSSDSTQKAESQLMEHVSAMMSQLPFDVSGRDPRNKHARVARGLTAQYRTSAIELTFEENLRGAVGQPLLEAESLQDLTFPVPPNVALPTP